MEKQNVLIVGGGYVGLPLAVEAGLAGVYSVKVLDNDEEKVKKINSGVSYIEDVQEASLLESDIVATTDKTIAGDADVVVICVPTPLRKTKDPDISYVVNAAREVAENLDLERGSMGPREVLIILESTVYPGFTREVLVSIFEDAGCPVSDRGPLHIAFSPERVDPGNSTYCTHNTPRVVGGVTDTCRDKAISFYRSFLSAEIVPMSSCDAAEMVKLLENSFRAVNIGMANELALICSRLGLSTREIVDGAKTKPFGFMPFYPGPGLGGHCFPGSEWLLARVSGHVRVLTFEELFSLTEHGDGGCVQVLSENLWRGVSAVFRRRFTGDLITLRTGYGREITATDQHPMLVVAPQGRLLETPACAIEKGKHLPFGPAGLRPDRSKAPCESNVLKALPGWLLEKIKIGVPGGWGELRNAIYSCTSSSAKYDWVNRGSGVPWPVYEKIASRVSANARESARLYTGKGAAQQAIPAVIQLTEPVLRMVGYYISEGCITKERKAHRVRWTFGPTKLDAMHDLCETLTSLGIRWSFHQQDNSYHIKVSSEVFAWWFEHVLGCGCDCYAKRTPRWALDLDDTRLVALLSGAFRGDGCLEINGGSTSISYWSASERLTREIAAALQMLGVHASFERKSGQVGLGLTIFGDVALGKLANILSSRKLALLKDAQALKTKGHRASRVLTSHETGLVSAEVMSVSRRAVENEYVYSLETEPEHVFQAGMGILVHNCIPVDPLYLSWKMKGKGYRTRFIDVADEINTRMPEYVVDLVSRALNSIDRAIRHSYIFVYGVAYKENTSDVRESPALLIMEELTRRGAYLRYIDPFVPKLRMLDGTELESVEHKGSSDCGLILAAHRGLPVPKEVLSRNRVVVDTRGYIPLALSAAVYRL